ncbi:MAG TPA: response regulator transcription factor [Bacteroidia bacterium]
MEGLKIMIAVDHSITRFGIKVLCNQTFKEPEILEIKTLGELYKQISYHKPNLVILDLIFNNLNCLSIIPDLVKLQHGSNVFILSNANETTYSDRVIESGAKGFIHKDCDNETFKAAIQRVACGQYYMSQDAYLEQLERLNMKKVEKNPFDLLSNKELEIVHYLTQGCSTTHISEKSRLAMSTVSTYKNRIFSKLQIKNVVALMELASTFQLK